MEKVVEKFLRYVKYDTQSDESSATYPSTSKQKDFGMYLVKELHGLGICDAAMDDNGYVSASISSNTDMDLPVIGFIAHMDTSPDFSGADVNPRMVTDYDGKDIVINSDKNLILSTSAFPELLNYKGQDIITTDGNTLLGADDKAGIAEIISALEYLLSNPDIKHGVIKVCFTPDEEIGRGVDYFDVSGFAADFAYTVDGGEVGELEYENFNAAAANITISGINIHPGTAKDKMLNSILIAAEFNSMLPGNEIPACTQGYEGFYHLGRFVGSVEKTTMHYIIRDFYRHSFMQRKSRLEKIAAYLNDKYGAGTVAVELRDQYYNMKEKVEPVMQIVDIAKKAMEEVGVTPKVQPIRGGTDGAQLSYKGLPTPNLFTGGLNYHGKFECIPVESMKKAVEVIVKIVELCGRQA